MTLKDLQGVLCGMVTLYEHTLEGINDLYCGMSQEIPEELQSREVRLASPVDRPGITGVTIDIQLAGVHKKSA